MMEKFLHDAEEYERRHSENWLGRTGSIGTGVSIQADLVSPFGIYDMVRNPNTFNLMKLGYLPALNYVAITGAAAIAGEKISFTHRLIHSVDMTLKTYKAAGQIVGRSALFAIRRTPGAIASGVLVGAGLWLQSLYHDLSGMYIGDIRFNR